MRSAAMASGEPASGEPASGEQASGEPASGGLKIGVLFNCQGQGIAAALRAMLPACSVQWFHVPGARDTKRARDDMQAALLACDHIVTVPLGRDEGVLSTEALRRAAPAVHALPPLGFRGFHPDMIYLHQAQRHVSGPTGDYQSRIAMAGYLGGLTAEQTAALYNALVFGRLGYFRACAEDFELVAERFGRCGVPAARLMARLRAGGCFMYSVNHPKIWALVEMARAACEMMGLQPGDVAPESLDDTLARHGTHPVFEAVAARIGVPAEGMFHAGVAPGAAPQPISTLDFVRGSFAVYDQLNPDLLLRADGVAAALAALGMAQADRPDMRQRPPEGDGAGRRVAFLTWHGTLLYVPPDASGAPPGTVGQVPVPVVALDEALLRVEPGLLGAVPTPVAVPGIPGAELRPGVAPGRVVLARGGMFLSPAAAPAAAPEAAREAGPDGAAGRAGFTRDAAGDTESFLPVPPPALLALRRLMAGSWRLQDAAAQTPAAQTPAARTPAAALAHPVPAPPASALLEKARMAPGFRVRLGSATVDLQRGWPRVLAPDRAGGARLAVLLDGEPVVLLGPPAADLAAAEAGRRRVEPGRQLAIIGAPAWLHAPLTMRGADRVWVQAACGLEAGLPWRVEAPRFEISRAAGRLVGDAGLQDGGPATGAHRGRGRCAAAGHRRPLCADRGAGQGGGRHGVDGAVDAAGGAVAARAVGHGDFAAARRGRGGASVAGARLEAVAVGAAAGAGSRGAGRDLGRCRAAMPVARRGVAGRARRGGG